MKARTTEIGLQYSNGDGGGIGPPLDLSILRKPIQTAITGFLEAIKAYENGTEEVNFY